MTETGKQWSPMESFPKPNRSRIVGGRAIDNMTGASHRIDSPERQSDEKPHVKEGSFVEVSDDVDNPDAVPTESFLLVHADSPDITHPNALGMGSVMGREFMGKEEGQRVTWSIPSKNPSASAVTETVVIVRITNPT